MAEWCMVCKCKFATSRPVPLLKCKQCGSGPICYMCDRSYESPIQAWPCRHWFCASCLDSCHQAYSKRIVAQNRFLIVEPLCLECDEPPHAYYYGNGPMVFVHRRLGNRTQHKRYQRTIANMRTCIMCWMHALESGDQRSTLPVELVQLCSEYTKPTGTLYEVIAASMDSSYISGLFSSRMVFVVKDDGFVSGIVSLRCNPGDLMPDIEHHRHHAQILCERSDRTCALSNLERVLIALIKYMLDGCHAMHANALYLYQDNIGVAQLRISPYSFELTIYKEAPLEVPRVLDGVISADIWRSIMCKKTHITYKTCISEEIRRACPVCSPDT